MNGSIKKVIDAGGEVLGEPLEIPGIGQYVSFIDTEGNRVSMLKPIRAIGMRRSENKRKSARTKKPTK